MGRSSELDGLTTLPELLEHSIRRWGDKEALRQYDRPSSKWESWTYGELGEHVLEWRRGFAAMGLRPGDRVAILMPNGRDHVCADQAALANGLIPVPLHAIDTPGASAFITIDSQACTLVTNKLSRWQQIRATGVEMPDLRSVLITDAGETEDKDDGEVRVRSLESVLADGKAWEGDLPAGPFEDDLAAIVYTSGTTGRPKGVMLTHRNIVSNVKATLECVSPREGDTFLSFLPLSHTFERTAGYYLALATGCIIAYNRSVLLLAEDLKVIRPTVIISVPRVYERIYARVQDKLRKSKPIAKKLFDWAVEVGWRDFCRRNHMPLEKSSRAWLDGIVRPLLVTRMANMLLSQFGGRLRIAISGGAALNNKVARTFCGLGLPIIQGYGMTEASPIIAGNCIEFNQPDTVGRPFCNVELRLAEGNEIQIRGPSIMKGYWRREDATDEAFTKDGWLHTGDVGEFNSEGMLRIKGRIKEIIVTSTGEKIPPADLESAIETDPLFEQCYIVGENRPYLTLISVVNTEEWERFAAAQGLDPKNPESLSAPAARTAALKRAKTAAGDFPNYALPRSVILTTEPWTIENGLITPTLKLKRGPLSKKFAAEITKLYATHG
ncbi:long-chain fatty acid--CoA ligase [Sutterella sp.]|uniref:AMP-dependent synthetase/ligase n=1 Tax=Sutterella sp. TaxID=1981025 RepID=UPI0026DF99C0|nr:AMP-dependent synthetase/ligase [Sutterella sp.]MDO5530374.1 AMP-dependent synthetase/ligase [Sutterella sp.]